MTKGYFNGGSGYFINREGKLESVPPNIPMPGEVTDQDKLDWEKEKFYASQKAPAAKQASPSDKAAPADSKKPDDNSVDVSDSSDVTDGDSGGGGGGGDGGGGDGGGGSYARGGPVRPANHYKSPGPVSTKFASGGAVLNASPSRFAKGR